MSATAAPSAIFRTFSATSGASSSSRSSRSSHSRALIAHDRREAPPADRVDAGLRCAARPHATTSASSAAARTTRMRSRAHMTRITIMTETTLTPSRLWKQMTLDQRPRAARAFWEDRPRRPTISFRPSLLIAQQKKFRPKTVIGLDVDRKARHLATLGALPDQIAARALIVYHLAEAAPDDGRVPRRARHRARERADQGRKRQAGRRRRSAPPRRRSRSSFRRTMCGST